MCGVKQLFLPVEGSNWTIGSLKPETNSGTVHSNRLLFDWKPGAPPIAIPFEADGIFLL